MQVARHNHGFVRRSNRRDRAEYRMILVLCFCSYFLMVLFRRLMSALTGRQPQSGRPRQSILAETSAAARIAAGYAFLG